MPLELQRIGATRIFVRELPRAREFYGVSRLSHNPTVVPA